MTDHTDMEDVVENTETVVSKTDRDLEAHTLDWRAHTQQLLDQTTQELAILSQGTRHWEACFGCSWPGASYEQVLKIQEARLRQEIETYDRNRITWKKYERQGAFPGRYVDCTELAVVVSGLRLPQSVVKTLGAEHVAWVMSQTHPAGTAQGKVHGAWLCSDLELMAIYSCLLDAIKTTAEKGS
jgi:hypothetical protein